MGISIEKCWDIEGFKDYVDYLAEFKDRSDIIHNNNVNSIRSFLGMFVDDENVALSMNLLTNMDNINRYVEFVHGMVGYVPKTCLQKIEALKKCIKWLKMCTFKDNCSYSGENDHRALTAILDVLCHECNILRPY